MNDGFGALGADRGPQLVRVVPLVGENVAAATLIETAKMCGVEPFGYLKDVLTRITAGHTINKIAELAPWNYIPKPSGQNALPADLQAAFFAENAADRKVMAA